MRWSLAVVRAHSLAYSNPSLHICYSCVSFLGKPSLVNKYVFGIHLRCIDLFDLGQRKSNFVTVSGAIVLLHWIAFQVYSLQMSLVLQLLLEIDECFSG